MICLKLCSKVRMKRIFPKARERIHSLFKQQRFFFFVWPFSFGDQPSKKIILEVDNDSAPIENRVNCEQVNCIKYLP
jgi:hypothetical protein